MWIRNMWLPDTLKAFVPEASRVEAAAQRAIGLRRQRRTPQIGRQPVKPQGVQPAPLRFGGP
jgi:hypothetical protein